MPRSRPPYPEEFRREAVELVKPADRDHGAATRAEVSVGRVAEQIGARLTGEQTRALTAITGPQRAAILIGPAGAGKGVVIEAAAQAEQLAGRQTCGIAVAGAITQRLGNDCPSLAGQTLTLDGLLARANNGPANNELRTAAADRVLQITPNGPAIIQLDITGRTIEIAGEDLAAVRLAYAQHIHRAQGTTVQHSLILTGGWQTSRQSAYVQATAPHATTAFALGMRLQSET